ncbi:MAG TPA: hypothetical protein VGA73_10005, partial [Candidatus Binatia bacterium]
MFFPDRWRPRHFILVLGLSALFAYFYVLVPDGPWSPAAPLFLALPILLALPHFFTLPPPAGLPARRFDKTPERGRGEGLSWVLLVWFLAAAVEFYQAHRFVIFFVVPFGLALAAGAARAHDWLAVGARALLPRRPRTAAVLASLVIALLIVPPVWRGYAAARGYYPSINRAWWDTLGKIRSESHPDAIVTTWWDYGYWVKYAAERRTSTDGASLLTHVPHWVAKALVAPSEAESAGILRMLACGSDATPLPEGARGAFGKLAGLGLDDIAAYSALADLVKLDRAGAERYLAGRGFSAAGQEDILSSTHCRPPEVFLVVSSELFYKTGAWVPHGAWDMKKSYMVRRSRLLPEDQAVADLVGRFGYSLKEAGEWYARVRALKSRAELESFPEPPPSFIPTEWIPCRSAGGSEMVCRMSMAGSD